MQQLIGNFYCKKELSLSSLKVSFKSVQTNNNNGGCVLTAVSPHVKNNLNLFKIEKEAE